MTVAYDLAVSSPLPTPVTPLTPPLTPPLTSPLTLRVLPAPPSAPPYDDEPGPAPTLVLLPTAEPLPALPLWDDSWWFTHDRTPAGALPAARPLVQALVQGLVEVLAGTRPLRLFRMHLDVHLYAELAARIEGGRITPGPRPQQVVHSVHVQVRPEGVVEACATVLRAGRPTAVALRLEGFEGRWVCTVLEGL